MTEPAEKLRNLLKSLEITLSSLETLQEELDEIHQDLSTLTLSTEHKATERYEITLNPLQIKEIPF